MVVTGLTVMADDTVASNLGNMCLPHLANTSTAFVNSAKGIREALRLFGLKTSSILREALMAMFLRYSVPFEAQLWVYMFCALAKTKARILSGIARLPETVKSSSQVIAASSFIRDHMVSWPAEETDTKFATVHTAATNPGLSTLLWSLANSNPGSSFPKEALYELTWFAQLKLSSAVLTEVKPIQMNYWNSVVKSSRSGKSPPGFKEDIWNNQVSDSYPIATFKVVGSELKIRYLEPNNPQIGFTEEELKFWWKELMMVLYPVEHMEVVGQDRAGGPGGIGDPFQEAGGVV